MRARNIKPGFFKNDKLAECSLLARFLFPGLWMLADRNGILEDRPKRIKAEILPFDDADIDELLNELQAKGFIERYKADGQDCIFVINFSKHQNPHHRERSSGLPFPNEKPEASLGQALDEPEDSPSLTQCQTKASPRQAHGKPKTSPELAQVQPSSSPAESLLLNTESYKEKKVKRKESHQEEKTKKSSRADWFPPLMSDFCDDEEIWHSFCVLRKLKRAPISLKAMEDLAKEASKVGLGPKEAIGVCIGKNWQSFHADLYLKDNPAIKSQLDYCPREICSSDKPVWIVEKVHQPAEVSFSPGAMQFIKEKIAQSHSQQQRSS